MADYAEALRLFNETVQNLSRVADLQRAETIAEVNAIQAQSVDPSDMGAYNLTMYGIDQVHFMKNNIVDTVGNASNYDLVNNTTVMALQTDQTAISASLLSGLADIILALASYFSDLVNLLLTHLLL
jgi:hypothetical protein